jgi:hypothetical protein
MTTHEMHDPILRLLATLPQTTPSAAFDGRVRAQCHAALVRQRRLAAHRREFAIRIARVINATLAITAGIYAAAAALEALTLAGML